MTELQKFRICVPYNMQDPTLVEHRYRCRYYMNIFNQYGGPYFDKEQYLAKLRNFMPNSNETSFIEPPFFCDYGFNIMLGANVFVNAGCKFLDAASIYIGDNTLIGPDVNIYASTHLLDAESRRNHVGVAKPVIIGSDCWIGGNSTILPGVSIGNNVVVGAGSVVTKNISDNSVVAGNPARIIKQP